MSGEDIEWLNSDCWVEIKCTCGHTLTFSDGGEEKTCDCGKIYKLNFYIELKDGEHQGD